MNHEPAPFADDLSLARRVLQRNAVAEQTFQQRMKVLPKLVSVINRRSGSPLPAHAIDDIAQDCLVQIWRKLEQFEGRGRLETWAYRFCYLEFMNALRKQGKALPSLEEVPEAEETAAPAPSPSGGIEAYLKHLGGREREVVHLRHVEDLQFSEIAEVLDIGTSSVKTHYYRALEKLRALRTGEES